MEELLKHSDQLDRQVALDAQVVEEYQQSLEEMTDQLQALDMQSTPSGSLGQKEEIARLECPDAFLSLFQQVQQIKRELLI